ncbi:tetratricopeptide repeat protein [Massilia forsythiae]|uniref:Tetratricopeptide repeat protein n=1 Tax=Massilia forsythiae TaxID=2728020 RepID=A0A7Z2VX21_9BURK|nr:tetratricopeptide repeat protein [Massilia forsythiae]QJE00708.1 tetratricopeptide repeat protein [Massilia forsythiae]
MSLRAHRLAAAALLALAGACAHAHGADGADAGAEETRAADSPQQTLYREALEALAEGRRTDASQALRRLVAEQPLHAGAWLDLALTQCALGNGDEAERLFATFETRFQPSQDILVLIAETREAGCKPWEPVRSTVVTAGRGIDRNVNQGASVTSLVVDRGQQPVELTLLPDFLPQRDDYSVVGVDYLRELTPNGSVGYVQYQARRNDHIHRYDSAALFAGVESPWRIGRWTVRAGATLGAVTLGGQLYQRQGQLQARATPALPLPAGTQLTVSGSATWNRYVTLTNFDSLTLEGRALLSWRSGPLVANAAFALLDDRARTQRPGGNRHGGIASLLLRRSLPASLTGELGYTRQTWGSAAPYAPELIDAVRAQRTEVLRTALSYQFAKHQTLQLEARAVRNRENIGIFQYNDRILQLSWQWQLP